MGMKFRRITAVAVMIGLWSSSLAVAHAAQATGKQPLDEAFDQLVVVPYDYQGKTFVHGKLSSVDINYRMVQVNGRVMVPIRLMSTLATQADGYQNDWQAVWQADKPNEVLVTNASAQGTKKKIKFTVGSKTMLVNDKPVQMDVAPQKVDGRIVLPLRSAAEALDKTIDWLDGLILIGNENVDLQSPQTLALVDRIKSELTDSRPSVEWEKSVDPLAQYGTTLYYYKPASGQLFKKTEDGKETQIPVAGTPEFGSAQLLDHKLYFLSTEKDQGTLYALDVAGGQVEKVCPIGQWDPTWGWFAGVRRIGSDLYVNLHVGDNTMGSETLYRVENGELKELAGAKSFINYVLDADSLYYTNFNTNVDPSNNLIHFDLKSGKGSIIGQAGYTYGVYREVGEGHVSYQSNSALYIQNGYLYVLGYKEANQKDVSSVYKINLTDNSQTKITSAASAFWLEGDRIYYPNNDQGSIESADLNGGDRKTLVNRAASDVRLIDGSFYYTTGSQIGIDSVPGTLYRYTLSTGVETKLSDKPVTSYYVGSAGIYYVASGYDRGLYRVDADGRNVRLVDDDIAQARLTEEGMVYALTYAEGIHSAK